MCTLSVKSSTAVLKVCIPPMAVPMRMPHLALSRPSNSSFCKPTPDASKACKVTCHFRERLLWRQEWYACEATGDCTNSDVPVCFEDADEEYVVHGGLHGFILSLNQICSACIL